MYDRYNSPRIYVNESGKLAVVHLIAGNGRRGGSPRVQPVERASIGIAPANEVDTEPLLVNVFGGEAL